MNAFLETLLSRKLIITVAGTIYFVATGNINQALALLLGYVGINGAIEMSENLKK